ncbi:PDR/VanB family oxidoreductase [Azospirillum sp. ST 5-10]|uniref:PDR/VanB family oxidoreductase n=1 Tax=unclassified Azospirillum TaxID=2630922 RepID=UPI003F4A3072
MIEVIVTRRVEEADNICVLDLERADGGSLPPFDAGAHVEVHLPDGRIRQYSLCNHPDERTRYQIGVLRAEPSRGGSAHIHDRIQVGGRLTIGEPRNLFPLDLHADHSLLIAGGIGATPLICMAERLHALGRPFAMHCCARTLSRQPFRDRIARSPFADRVRFHLDDGPEEQRLACSAVIGAPAPGRHLYVCGPTGFMEHVLAAARELGWPDGALHREYFEAAERTAGGDRPFEVEIASTGEVFQIPADRSIAEVLEDAGMVLPLSCEQGVCGSCLTRVLEGEPDHRDLILSAAEHAANDRMTPCVSRCLGRRLVLDL